MRAKNEGRNNANALLMRIKSSLLILQITCCSMLEKRHKVSPLPPPLLSQSLSYIHPPHPHA